MMAPQPAAQCGTTVEHDTTPCGFCEAPVVIGVMLARQPTGDVQQRDVVVEPQTLALALPTTDAGLLLHLGRFANTPRWLLAAADDRAAPGASRMLRHPHGHRLHVCSAAPAAWLTTALTASAS